MSLREGNSPPVVIVGAQRSGTTMLSLMLNSHPDLAVPFESDFLAPLSQGISRVPFASRADAERAVSALAVEPFSRRGGLVEDPLEVLNECPRDYAELVRFVMARYARRRGKRRWGVKSPGYNARLDEVIELWPDAFLVHIVRDGRDVAVSNRHVSWGSCHTPRVARDWRWKVMLGRKSGRMRAGQYHEVRYEDLVRSPGEALSTLCGFLGLRYDSGMLDYHLAARAEMPAGSLQWHESSVSRPDSRKIGAWRSQLPLSDVLLFQEEAGDALETFGYDLVTPRARLSVALRRTYYTLVQRW
jgi:hypothetical protein